MYKGKYSNRKKRRLAPWAALALALVLTLSVGGTIAYLITDTDPVENTFTPAEVEIEIEETVANNTKTSIAVKNIGDTDAYIRVTLVSNWGKMVGDKWVVCGDTSHNHSNFTLEKEYLGDGWIEIGGYYYYTSPVKHGNNNNNVTSNLLGNKDDNQVVISLNQDAENGCIQQVTVLAQAIQAEPSTAINKAWGIPLNETTGDPVFSTSN